MRPLRSPSPHATAAVGVERPIGDPLLLGEHEVARGIRLGRVGPDRTSVTPPDRRRTSGWVERSRRGHHLDGELIEVAGPGEVVAVGRGLRVVGEPADDVEVLPGRAFLGESGDHGLGSRECATGESSGGCSGECRGHVGREGADGGRFGFPGDATLPPGFTEQQLRDAPVLASADQLIIEDLTEEESEAFDRALNSRDWSSTPASSAHRSTRGVRFSSHRTSSTSAAISSSWQLRPSPSCGSALCSPGGVTVVEPNSKIASRPPR